MSYLFKGIAVLAGAGVFGVLINEFFEKAGEFVNQRRAGQNARRQPTNNANSKGKPTNYRVSCHWLPAEELEVLTQPGDIVEFLRVYRVWDLPRLVLAFAGFCEHPERVPSEQWTEERRDLFAYIHAGVCVGTTDDGERLVVHYSDTTRPVTIVKEPLQSVADGCVCRVCNRFDTVYMPLSTAQVVDEATLATSGFLPFQYNFITFNCQHLAHWFRYQVARSPEVDVVTKAFLSLLLAIALGNKSSMANKERMLHLVFSLLKFFEHVRHFETGYRDSSTDEEHRQGERFEPEYVCNCQGGKHTVALPKTDRVLVPTVPLGADAFDPLQANNIVDPRELWQQYIKIVASVEAFINEVHREQMKSIFRNLGASSSISQQQQHQQQSLGSMVTEQVSFDDDRTSMVQYFPSSVSLNSRAEGNGTTFFAASAMLRQLAAIVFGTTQNDDNIGPSSSSTSPYSGAANHEQLSSISDELCPMAVAYCFHKAMESLDDWMKTAYMVVPALPLPDTLVQEIRLLGITNGKTTNGVKEAQNGGNDEQKDN